MAVTNEDITQAATDVVEAAYRAQVRVSSNNPDGVPRTEISEADYVESQERIMQACTPDPENARSIISALNLAVGDEGLGSGELGAVSDLSRIIGPDAEQWNGTTADNFNTYYIAPFNDCRNNQIAAIGELKGSMEALADILDLRRKDYVAACEKTVKALDGVGACTLTSVSVTLAIVGTAISIGSASIATGASLAWAVAGAGQSALSTGVTITQNIKGMTVKGVLKSLDKALNEIDKAAKELSEGLAGLVEESEGTTSTAVMKDRTGRIPMILPHEPNPAGSDAPRVTDGDASAIEDGFRPPSD